MGRLLFINMAGLLLEMGEVKSKNEAKRLIKQGAVKIGDVGKRFEKITSPLVLADIDSTPVMFYGA